MARYNASNGEMDFGMALDSVKAGRKVTRTGWNGKDQWLKLQEPDDMSKMSLPYIYIRTAQGTLVPWVASHSDLLSLDWVEVI